MDKAPLPPHAIIHPNGFYEDARLVEANMLFLHGHGGRTPEIRLRAWTRRFKRYFKSMQKLKRPWGFKDPRLIPLLAYALSFFNSPIIIRCHRPRAMVIKSYIEKLNWQPPAAAAHYDRDEANLDIILKNIDHIRFDFDSYISEEKIIAFLQNLKVIRHGA